MRLQAPLLRLPVAALLLLLLTNARGQEVVDTDSINIDEVTVRAHRRAQSYSDLLRVVRVVDPQELGDMEGASLPELLERLALVDIRQRGQQGVQADINFRGGTFDQTLVLLNGVNINDPQTGHNTLAIPISLDAVARIEILQGSGAREYGQGAFAGAINIITKPSDDSQAHLSAAGGQYGLAKVTASTSLGGKHFRTFLSASYDRSDGYIPNTDFQSASLYSHSSLRWNTGNVDLVVGYGFKGFGANSFYSPKYPNQYEAVRTTIAQLLYRHRVGRWNIMSDVYYRLGYDRFELFRSDPPAWYTGHNYHQTHTYGFKPAAERVFEWGKTAFGAELRGEEIISTNLGHPLSKRIPVPGAGVTIYKMGDWRGIASGYLSQSFYIKDLIASLGVQYAYSNPFGHLWTYGLDLSHPIGRYFRAFASANRVYRPPTFTDLYYASPTNIGNDALKPEFAMVYEMGLKFRLKEYLSAQVAGFARIGSDVIDWVRAPSETVWHTMNYTRVNSFGVDFLSEARLDHIHPLLAAINLGYSFVHSDTQTDELDSYYALDYLKHNLSFGMRHRIWSTLELAWNARYQHRTGTYVAYPSNQPTAYPSFWLLDAQLSYRYRWITAFANVSNILNARYVDIGNVPQPGIWAVGGIRIALGWGKENGKTVLREVAR